MIELQEERKFIHELASPLAAAIFMTDVLLEVAKRAAEPEPIANLVLIQESLAQLRTLIQDRRAILIARSPE